MTTSGGFIGLQLIQPGADRPPRLGVLLGLA